MTNRMPQASVVIPARDAEDTLATQLQALAAQDFLQSFEVIVVDNGSRDATPEVAASFHATIPSLRVIDAGDVAGVSHARNVGILAARGDLLAFCDADDRVWPNWLRALATAAQDADLVTGFRDSAALNSPRQRAYRWNRDPSKPLTLAGYEFAPGATMAVWRDTAIAVGGFSTCYRQGEDAEFSIRLQLHGHSLAAATEAVIDYRFRGSTLDLWRQQVRYGRGAGKAAAAYADLGATPITWGQIVRAVGWLAVRVPTLATTARRRGIWLRNAGSWLGRAQARLRYGGSAPYLRGPHAGLAQAARTLRAQARDQGASK